MEGQPINRGRTETSAKMVGVDTGESNGMGSSIRDLAPGVTANSGRGQLAGNFVAKFSGAIAQVIRPTAAVVRPGNHQIDCNTAASNSPVGFRRDDNFVDWYFAFSLFELTVRHGQLDDGGGTLWSTRASGFAGQFAD